MERLLTGSMDTKMFLEITTWKTFLYFIAPITTHETVISCLMYEKTNVFHFIFLTEGDSFTVDSLGYILGNKREVEDKSNIKGDPDE